MAHSLPELSLNRFNTQLDMNKALIVEDDPDLQFLQSRLINSMGFAVISANNGKEGVEKAINEKPDLIFMDILMPGMDGREATRRIRSNQETEEIPILAVTAIIDKSQLRECIEAGCNDVIVKPFTAEDLQEKIRQL